MEGHEMIRMSPVKKKSRRRDQSSSSSSSPSSEEESSQDSQASESPIQVSAFLKKATLSTTEKRRLKNLIKLGVQQETAIKKKKKREGKKKKKHPVDSESSDLSDLRSTDDGDSAKELPNVSTKRRSKPKEGNKKEKPTGSQTRKSNTEKSKRNNAETPKATPKKKSEQRKKVVSTPVRKKNNYNGSAPGTPASQGRTPKKKQTRNGRPVVSWLSSGDEPDPIDDDNMTIEEKKKMEERQRNTNWEEREMLIVYTEGKQYHATLTGEHSALTRIERQKESALVLAKLKSLVNAECGKNRTRHQIHYKMQDQKSKVRSKQRDIILAREKPGGEGKVKELTRAEEACLWFHGDESYDFIPGARGWKVDYEGLDDSGELYDEIEKGKAEQSARKEDHKKARKQERKQIKELKKAQKEKDKDNEVEASEADDESEKADESHNASPRRKISVKKDKKQSKARNVFVDVSENVSPELPEKQTKSKLHQIISDQELSPEKPSPKKISKGFLSRHQTSSSKSVSQASGKGTPKSRSSPLQKKASPYSPKHDASIGDMLADVTGQWDGKELDLTVDSAEPDSLLDGDPNSQPADENVDFTRASQDTSTPKSRQQGKQEDQGKKTSQTIPVKATTKSNLTVTDVVAETNGTRNKTLPSKDEVAGLEAGLQPERLEVGPVIKKGVVGVKNPATKRTETEKVVQRNQDIIEEEFRASMAAIDGRLATLTNREDATNKRIGTIENMLTRAHLENINMNTEMQSVSTTSNNIVKQMDNIVRTLDVAVNTNIRNLELLGQTVNVETKGISTTSNYIVENVLTLKQGNKEVMDKLLHATKATDCVSASVEAVKSGTDQIKKGVASMCTTTVNMNASIEALTLSTNDLKADIGVLKTQAVSIEERLSNLTEVTTNIAKDMKCINENEKKLKTMMGNAQDTLSNIEVILGSLARNPKTQSKVIGVKAAEEVVIKITSGDNCNVKVNDVLTAQEPHKIIANSKDKDSHISLQNDPSVSGEDMTPAVPVILRRVAQYAPASCNQQAGSLPLANAMDEAAASDASQDNFKDDGSQKIRVLDSMDSDENTWADSEREEKENLEAAGIIMTLSESPDASSALEKHKQDSFEFPQKEHVATVLDSQDLQDEHTSYDVLQCLDSSQCGQRTSPDKVKFSWLGRHKRAATPPSPVDSDASTIDPNIYRSDPESVDVVPPTQEEHRAVAIRRSSRMRKCKVFYD